MRIVSDFRDYYDSPAEESGLELQRLLAAQPSRQQRLDILARAGLVTPLHGSALSVATALCNAWMVSPPGPQENEQTKAFLDRCDVVRYDSSGRVNAKTPAWEAMRAYPDQYCAELIPAGNRATIWRYVQVGDRRFWLTIVSSHAWNAEELGYGATTQLQGSDVGYHHLLPYPLFSVDFIPGKHLHAINFSTAPMLAQTPIEEELSGETVRRLLSMALRRLSRNS